MMLYFLAIKMVTKVRLLADSSQEKERKIIEAAENKAQQIIEAAKKKSTEINSNAEAELKLFASQALEALKTEVTNIITDKLSTSNVKAAMEDKAFMQKLITNMMQNWSKDQSMVIGVEKKEELEEHIKTNAKSLLDNTLKVESVNGVKTGFIIAPEDGSYKVKFGEDEFIAYFKEFLRPQIQKLIF